MFLGNSYLVNNFKKLTEAKKLSHGYIFFGENQIGKKTFALFLANFLENKEFVAPKKSLTETLFINETGIDSVKKIKEFLWQKPVNSEKRVVVIDGADMLTTEAQNAILKITEEPPENSLIILISNNLDNILPPIVSRLQKIYFSRVLKKELADYLVDQLNLKQEKAEEVAEMTSGKPGKAIDLVQKDYSDIEDLVKKYMKLSGNLKSQFIKEFVELQKEKPEILDLFFELLLYKLEKDPIKNNQQIKAILSRLFLIKSYNVNKRLQIEAI